MAKLEFRNYTLIREKEIDVHCLIAVSRYNGVIYRYACVQYKIKFIQTKGRVLKSNSTYFCYVLCGEKTANYY